MTMAARSSYSTLKSIFLLRTIPVHAFVLSVFAPELGDAAIIPEKHLQRTEIYPFSPFFWTNEGLLFADILLQKMLLPFGLTSPYTNLFLTEAVRDIAASIAAVKGGSEPRKLRGRRLQQEGDTAKDMLRSFVRSLHAALKGNIFDINFADELIKHLPAGLSGQIASITETFGKDFLHVLAEAENPASAIVQHLLEPFGNGELAIPDSGGTDDINGAGRMAFRRLQQLPQLDPRHEEEVHLLNRIASADERRGQEMNSKISLLGEGGVKLPRYENTAASADASSEKGDRGKQ